MTDLAIVRWIRELDENGAVALARALIFAEAGRHGLPLDQFTMSGRVKARDQGVDGRTHFPNDPAILLPVGPAAWQVKSGASPPSAKDEFDESKHKALFDAIRNDGYNYVLFWANDPVDPAISGVKESFTAAVKSVRADATVTFLFSEAIERLCYAHLGVLAQQSPIPIAGVVGLEVWAPQEFGAVAFHADRDRQDFIEALRAHVLSESSPVEIHVYGDTGVGKSRLVFEALLQAGIAERVLIVPDASRWDPGLLTLVAQFPERSLVIVIDDCDADDRRAFVRYSDMARGRIRLITIGSRSTRERAPTDSRYVELLPLEAAASKEIALSVGLAERDADVVAEYTEGYPGLALTLAKAIRYGDAGGSLIERVRGHEEIGGVLSSLLPPADVGPLGMVALFERIGYEGDVGEELAVACQVLGVDESVLREICDRELNRFVSSAGRYRRVTPRLFALWLASQFMRDRRDGLVTALTELPQFLRDPIVAQMRDFAGDQIVADTLGEILGRSPFLSGALGDVDEGAARLVHVAAIAAPEAAMDALERVLDGVDTGRLRQYESGRRELVWALEVLLWYEQLFDRAADVLLRLAVAENETWSNNATGVMQGVFRVFLGGTGAPYEARLRWARRALVELGDSATPILVVGLGHALDVQESRTSTHFGGRTAPPEWRPELVSDEVDARGGAWDLLIEIAHRQDAHSELVAKTLARGLRTAMRRGLGDRVLADLRQVTWTPAGRGALGDALTKALKYDHPPEELAADLRALEAEIQGTDLQERLEYVLSLSPWQLSRDEESVHGHPEILRELASDLSASPASVRLDAAERSREGDSQTAGVLFEEVALSMRDQALVVELEGLIPTPDAALLGVLRGLATALGEDWADSVLERWLDSPFARLVVNGAHLLEPSDRRAALAVRAVDQGAAAPSQLGRLLYGAWARPLAESSVLEILRRLSASGEPHDVEAGLGILEQWLEDRENPQATDDLRTVGTGLVAQANELSDRSSPMISLYRERVVRHLGITFDERLQIVTELFRGIDSFPDQYDLELLDSLTSDEPTRTLAAVLDLILGEPEESFRPWLMWLEDAKILSRIAKDRDSSLVEQMLRDVDESDWPTLVAHIDFTSDDPDPIVIALLGQSSNEVLRARASFRFMYPATAWTGPESEYLTSRRAVAERWRADQESSDQFVSWIDETIESINQRAAVAEQNEAERGY